MNTLQAGFGRVNVNPMMGLPMRGYFKPRFTEAILDDLEINALALACGDTKLLLMSLDCCAMDTKDAERFVKNIAEATGLPEEAIITHATHTHTSTSIGFTAENDLVREYTEFLNKRFIDAANFALADLKPAKMGYGIGHAPNIAFVRRFRMKDGSVRTNPGVDNPDILHPIGDVDERVNVVRFDREGGDSVVLVNFGDHPDVVGGCKISD